MNKLTAVRSEVEALRKKADNYYRNDNLKWCQYEARAYSKVLDIVDKALKSSDETKSVLYLSDGYADGYPVYDEAECPNCGRGFEEDSETWECDFCPDCGQALDWTMKGEDDSAE